MIATCSGCQARYQLDATKVPERQIRVRCPDCATVFELDGTRREPTVASAPAAQAPAAHVPAVEPVAPPTPPTVAIDSPATSQAEPTPPPSGADDLALAPDSPAAAVEPVAAESAPEPAPEPDPVPEPDPEPAPESASEPATETPVKASASLDTPEPALRPAPAPPSAPAAEAKPQGGGTATAVAEEAPRSGRRRRRDKTEMLARALVSDILVYNREVRDQALAAGNLLEALGPEIKKSWELYKEKVGAEAASNTNYFKDALNEILAEGEKVF